MEILKYVGGDIKAVRKVLMKNTLKFLGVITLVAVIVVCFASCDFLSDKDKDDDGSNGIATKFEGTWHSVGHPDNYYIISKNTILERLYARNGRDHLRGTFTFTENELRVIITGYWSMSRWEDRNLTAMHQYTFIDDNTFVIVDDYFYGDISLRGMGGDIPLMHIGTYNKLTE